MQKLDALLLTRHWRDTPQGIELSFWGQSEEGPVRLIFSQQQAVCFVTADSEDLARMSGYPDSERKNLSLHTLNNEPVDGLYFNSQRDLQAFRQVAEREHRFLYESDLKPSDRFLMERFIHLGFTLQGAGVAKPGYREFHAPQLKPCSRLPTLRYLSLDIETDGIHGEIISIALSAPDFATVLMQGSPDQWPDNPHHMHWVVDEKTLLQTFLKTVSDYDPDLLLGWNLINFDIDYLERRAKHHCLPFTLGRGGELATVLQPQTQQQPRIASIPGRVALDGIDNLKAAFWSFERFDLESVAQALLGQGKLITGTTDKVAEIQRLYREDRTALAAYNLEDCRLVEAIFEKTDLLNFTIQRAVMTGLPLGRQGGSVAAFDNLYLPKLHRAGYVALDIGGIQHSQSSPGGYVLDSLPGLYENVLVLDFKSLYPSIIRTFRIDPLGLHQPGEDSIPGFLGASFSRTIGILPEIISDLWQQRETAKREHNAPLSQAIKIIMNSFYGVLGSSGCRFFDPRLASSITRRGHEIIHNSKEWIEQQGFSVIYGDTDSLFVLMGPGYSEAQAEKTGKQLTGELNQWWRQRMRERFRLESALEVEYEHHFIRFLMPTIRGAEKGSKKRYAGYIREKNREFRMIFKGLESVRSDWTPLAKRFQQELYRRIFFNEPYEAFILDTVTRLKQGELDHELVYSKRLRRPLASYIKNIPPHVQAARKLGKPGKTIQYLVTLNGPEPVPLVSSPIDHDHYLEKQLAPVADAILYFLNKDFHQIANDQMSLTF